MEEKNTVFVGNLSFKIDKQQLEELFSKFGTITEVKIPTNRETGQPRGFAFVRFDSEGSAQDALAFDGTDLNGRNVRVNIAHGRQEGGLPRRDRGGSSRRPY